MSDLVCPKCGDEEHLIGHRDGEAIIVKCEACDLSWTRNMTKRCPTCGGDDLEVAIKAIVERSRGTQLSIVATQPLDLCRVCDAEVLDSYRISRSPLMPSELPTT
jgi:hypothetical protein